VSAPRTREAQLVFDGRELVVHVMALLRAVHLYDSRNDRISDVCSKIRAKLVALGEDGGDVELAVRHDSIYLNGERIREGSVGSSMYHGFVDLLRVAGLRSIRIEIEVGDEELELLARMLTEVAQDTRTPEQLRAELKVRVPHIAVEARDESDEIIKEVDQELVAKQIYLRSIGVVKGVFHSISTTDRINSRRIKRVVQQMIESMSISPEHLLNLTNLKNYDEYTFNHSVNVGVLGIALGRHVGLNRQQLYVIGQAGMLHDLGKLCVPKAILNKAGRLTREERRAIEMHPVDGFITAAHKLGVQDQSIDVALAAYEHHMNADGSGYPRAPAAGALGLLSRIVAVVDRYDAMTSARVYRREPIPPHKALAIMYHSQNAHFDKGMLRYFLNMMGFFPLGTVVRLSDGSISVVVGSPEEVELRHYPRVKRILDPDGRAAGGEIVDLAATAKDPEPLRVEETVEAGEYGIEVMDYIL
jgi:HD-GYP domain-containing protein (c-di-GMP phosphodiesterase class II)